MPIVNFISMLLRIINGVIVPLIFAIAFLAFLWGIFTFFFNDNEEKRKEGRNFAFAGIIGFFLMFSVWGITKLLVDTFGFGSVNRPDVPHFER